MELQSFWTDSSKRPIPLRYCCYVRQAMLLSHHTSCSHAVKNTSRSKEETDNVPTDKTEQVTFGMKQFSNFLGNNKYRFVARNCTPFFKFRSTDVNLLSCLFFFLTKMADSALWLVRLPVNQTLCEGSIELYQWHEFGDGNVCLAGLPCKIANLTYAQNWNIA